MIIVKVLQNKLGSVIIKEEHQGLVGFIAKGLTVKQAAKKLKMKPRTAESNIARLKGRLGVDSLPQLIALFLREGIIK